MFRQVKGSRWRRFVKGMDTSPEGEACRAGIPASIRFKLTSFSAAAVIATASSVLLSTLTNYCEVFDQPFPDFLIGVKLSAGFCEDRFVTRE